MTDTIKYPSANPNKNFFIADSYLSDKNDRVFPPFTRTKSFSFRFIIYSLDYILTNPCKKSQNSLRQSILLNTIANQRITKNLYELHEARD